MNEQNNRQLRLSRQAELVADPEGLTMLIIGVGGIGSNAAHVAMSVGFEELTIMDPDVVMEENLYPGFFSHGDQGRPKVEALYDRLYDVFGNTIDVEPIVGSFPDHDEFPTFDIVLICTDTLESRREAWRHGRELCRGVWIDARMGGTLSTVYAIDREDQDAMRDYDMELREGREGELPCGQKATAPLTKGFINGMIGKVLIDIANGDKPLHMQRYDLAFGDMIRQELPPAREVNDAETPE